MRRTARRAGGRPERDGRGRGRFRDGQRRVPRRPLDQGRRRRLQARSAGALRPHVRDQPRPDPLRSARAFAVGDAHDAALGRPARRPGQGVAQRPPGRRGAGRGADRRTEGPVRKRQGSAEPRRTPAAAKPTGSISNRSCSRSTISARPSRRRLATPSSSSLRPTSIARATRRSVCCANCRAWANSASNAIRGTCRPLDALDPEGAYLAWRVELTTAEDEAAIHELFEFVVDDCELEIVVDRAGAAAALEANAPAEAAPSAPSVAASAFASPIVSAPAEPIEAVAASDRRRA